MSVRVALWVFLAGFAGDLLSKEWAVAHAGGLLYHRAPGELPVRVVMSLLAISVAFLLARAAVARGLGRQWGLVAGCALLVAGVLGNGVSPYLWPDGVPDFIGMPGDWVWNVADFEIAVGIAGGLLSVVATAVLVYAREQAALRRAA